MSESASQQLLQRIRRGDQAALAQLLEAHQARLFNVCLRMLNNREDAAEVTQDAMLKIVQSIHNFRGEAEVTTWMIRIAMNQSISRLRRRKRRQTLSLDHHANGTPDDDQASTLRHRLADHREPSPDAGVQQQESHQQLQDTLDQLDPDFRAVLVLRDIDQMNYQQISQALNLAVGTVKSRLFRARLALRQKLHQMETDADPGQRSRPEASDG